MSFFLGGGGVSWESESERLTNKLSENGLAVHAICFFRGAIHSPLNPEKNSAVNIYIYFLQ